ncbi:MAG: bifunctional glutamate N-acetyltransferase/amino-acid acetyltransferase ArgJ [Candidatus Omnitrophica bacterium]|nr:bifunctional glutamate N-acetyltransferase/amino-acid acetyltransferase ArgJ [Candidatus Omnitrophota bacterium]
MKNIKKIKNGTICTPLGFKTNAINCGIKNNKLDLALIYSIVKAKAAGVFTANKVKAAPVLLDIANLKDNAAQAIIVNSGNANCCTGKRGYSDAQAVGRKVADVLEINQADVLVASTGIIGKYLPKDKIIDSIELLAKGLEFDKADKTAQAMMTTDSFSKQVAVEFKIAGKKVSIAAVAKGAGMICPNMATMLCFVTTDANISVSGLKKALKLAADYSFNCISVDGDMSTNDTLTVLANGLAGNALIKDKGKNFVLFVRALSEICLELAKMIVIDGEGATKLIEINVQGAKTEQQAKQAARQIANSLLVKTMIAGENPNWGRIPASVGAAGIDFKEEKLEVFLQNIPVYRKLTPDVKNRKKLIKLLAEKQINITVKLNNGKFSHTIWGNDLTKEYVRINTEYN